MENSIYDWVNTHNVVINDAFETFITMFGGECSKINWNDERIFRDFCNLLYESMSIFSLKKTIA